MTPARPANLAASIRARLLNIARTQGVDFNQVLVRFALERILYRLAQSQHVERFLLKGALLFTLWYDMPHRATRDADLLGFGASDLDTVARTFREIAAVTVDDGIAFDPASVTVEEIRKEVGYGGVRVVIAGELAKARCRTQIDVGFGDAVTPGPEDSVYPVLLGDLPAPRLRTYPTYTVVAEKLHAIALLGMANSRLKDYFDLSVLLERETLDSGILARAIKATFERRGTALPAALPIGLTEEFAQDVSRQSLWRAFLEKNDLPYEPLSAIVQSLQAALVSALNQP
jgi:predicted nucleotidyltransferase component of viral defense system